MDSQDRVIKNVADSYMHTQIKNDRINCRRIHGNEVQSLKSLQSEDKKGMIIIQLFNNKYGSISMVIISMAGPTSIYFKSVQLAATTIIRKNLSISSHP